MSAPIMYDLACQGENKCWSLNALKTRLTLNLKGIDYTTMWLQYPEIISTLEPLGISPHKGDDLKRYGTPYTIPVVRLGPLSTVMDSDAIASALESSIPKPSLQLDHPIRATVQQLVFKVQKAIQGDIIPLIAKNVIDTPSQEYFNSNKGKDFGMPLDEVLEEMGGEKCYEKATAPLEEVAALLKKEEGPFFLGKEPCYADFIWVSFVEFCRRATQDAFDRFVKVDEVFKDHYEACAPYMEKLD